MSEAVRKALEAAGEATWQTIDLIGDIPPPPRQAEQIAAAAIAAFLEALPKARHRIPMADHPGPSEWITLKALAAAVRRAGEG